MEKKFDFSDRPLVTKIVYGVVIGILCLTAIIVGIIAAASKPQEVPEDNTPIETPDINEKPEDEKPEEPTNTELYFIAPTAGSVMEEHDMSVPVYSETLGAWRVHAGVDIAAEDGADVKAAKSGVIKKVYTDAKLGFTVEIEHEGGFVTRYANLKADSCPLKEGAEVKAGELIGKVGDTATSEIAKEPHLHFEILKDGKKVNPLEHIGEESKRQDLGIK